MKTTAFDLGKYGEISVYGHDYIIHNSIHKNNELWCRELFDYVVGLVERENPTLVDVGGHCGLFSIPFCKVTGGNAVVFEPQENLFKLLNNNISHNSLENVCETRKCAIGSEQKYISLNNGDEGYPASNNEGLPSNLGGVGIGEGGEENIELTTIDCMDLPACDLLKIDVEGAEPYVIEGAMETIMKYKPVIVYENNWKVANEYMKTMMGPPINVTEFLTGVGYSFEFKDADTVAYIKK